MMLSVDARSLEVQELDTRESLGHELSGHCQCVWNDLRHRLPHYRHHRPWKKKENL